jgi:acyl carrier protein
VWVTGIPNARVGFDLHLLNGLNPDATKADIAAAFASDGAIDPEDCWALADRLGVRCSVVWSSQPGYFDALWSAAPDDRATIASAEGRPLTNDPAASRRRRAFSSYLRAYLEKKLPAYMLPNHIIVLDALPVKTTGKVDRAALPEPEDAHADGATTWIGPKTETEREIASLWEDTLGVRQAGMDDDFFAMGGHSLLAVQLLHRIRQHFRTEIPLAALFEERTLGKLARRVDAARTKIASPDGAAMVEEGVL